MPYTEHMYEVKCCEEGKEHVLYEDGHWVMFVDGMKLNVTVCPFCGARGFTERTNHEIFLDRLDKSQLAVWTISLWLMDDLDWPVVIYPTDKAPSPDVQEQYVDIGDVDLLKWDNGKPKFYPINVKKLTIDFTNANDYPYSNLMVCAKHSYDKAKRPFWAYILLNKDETCAAIVKTTTREHWFVKEGRKDKDYNTTYRQDKYMCPLEHVEFKEIDFSFPMKPPRPV